MNNSNFIIKHHPIHIISDNHRQTVTLHSLFIEAKAAKEVGIQSVIMLRPGNAPLTEKELEGFKTMKSFHELDFEELEPSRKKVKSE